MLPSKEGRRAHINLLLGTLKEINCKVYPLSREEPNLLCTFVMEEKDKGYIYKGMHVSLKPNLNLEFKQ